MKCIICGSSGYDGALDDNGQFICVDCWAEGAAEDGHVATTFIGADCCIPISYPPDVIEKTLAAYNRGRVH